MYIDPTRYSGRPADCASRLPKEQRCYDLLGRLGIAYFRVDHDHADTIEACEAVEQVLGEKICKNLFLCNRQKTQFYLLMLEGEKVFKTKDLSKQLGVARLSFADPADMEKYLDITPGSVSVLGLMNDPDNAVQLVIDRPIAESASIGCHPLHQLLHPRHRHGGHPRKIPPRRPPSPHPCRPSGPGVTSPPRFAQHLPFTRGGFFTPAPKAPLVKGSWRGAPEGLPRRSGPKAPLPGTLSPKVTERLSQIWHDLSVSAPPSHLP